MEFSHGFFPKVTRQGFPRRMFRISCFLKTSSRCFRVSRHGEISGTATFLPGVFIGLFRNHLPKWSKENHVQQQLWIKSYVTTWWFIRFDSYPILPSCYMDDECFRVQKIWSHISGCTSFHQTQVVYLLSYYGLMLPAGYALAFHYGCGVKGIW